MSRVRQRYKHIGDQAEVNLTPMLDIVFIMLIFFIVTASFVKEIGIDVTRPESEQQEKQLQQGITIRITDKGDIWIDNRPIDRFQVRANLERLHAERPQASAVIQSDPLAKTGLAIEVMDEARRAGIPSVAIATGEE